MQQGFVAAPRSSCDEFRTDGPAQTNREWLTPTLAYAPQVPYIRHGTILDNILFGQPFWEGRYREVVRQCGLLPDLGALEDGDMTEIGEGGVNLVRPVRLQADNAERRSESPN